MTCALSEDSDQPDIRLDWLETSLIRDWVDAQADLSFRWAQKFLLMSDCEGYGYDFFGIVLHLYKWHLIFVSVWKKWRHWSYITIC